MAKKNPALEIDLVPGLLKKMKKLTSQEVLVGIPGEEGPREDGDPMNNATLGYLHENGSPANNIPPRPFLVTGVTGAMKAIVPELAKAANKSIDGDVRAVHKGLDRVGMIAQNAVKRKITTGPFIALKESTLLARRRKGYKGTKPLIRTGQLRNAITYVLKES